MSFDAKSPDGELDRHRPYLVLLARAQLNPRTAQRFDASDIVQQTMLEAHATWEQCRGAEPAQRAAWLRQILAHNLADALRGVGRAKRDAKREQSLETISASLRQSSARLDAWLAADQSSPSQHAQLEERAIGLANAMAALPDAQREALVLQYWHDLSLAEIAEQLHRTPAAVAGLLKRGLKQLRLSLRELQDRSDL